MSHSQDLVLCITHLATNTYLSAVIQHTPETREGLLEHYIDAPQFASDSCCTAHRRVERTVQR